MDLPSKSLYFGMGGRYSHPQGSTKTGSVGRDLSSAKYYGIQERVEWFPSSMIQLHESVSDTQNGSLSLSSWPLTPSLLAPRKLPTLFSDFLSAPFLMSIAQRAFGSGSLVWSPSLEGPGFPDLGTCTGSLLTAALMSSAQVGCTS